MKQPSCNRFHPRNRSRPTWAAAAAALVISFLACVQTALAEEPPQFVTMWGSYGSGPGQLIAPWGIATDAAGYVYVGDQFNYRVCKFTAEGAFVGSMGTHGSGPGQFAQVAGVATDGAGRVFAVDYANHRVQVFTSEGAFVNQIGSRGSGDGQLNSPYDVAIGPEGKVYVADHGNSRIEVFDNNGSFLASLGVGILHGPTGVAVDEAGKVYVDEAYRVAVLDPSGQLVLAWGNPGPGGGAGLDLDGAGSLYVANHGNSRIDKFALDGSLLGSWGNEFNNVLDVTIGPSGAIFVTDVGNHRIQKFAYAIPDSVPGLPQPTFTPSSPGQPASIYLGDTLAITLGVRNVAYRSDDGRISVSFPSFSDPADTARVTCSGTGDLPGFLETPAGGGLVGADCSPVTASYLVAEYADLDWKPLELNSSTFTIVPRTAGTFEFYVRSTMHSTVGGACAFVNGLPLGGDAGYIDQQGWAVKRFSVNVVPQPTLALPTFVTLTGVQADSIGLGDSLTVSVVVRNDGAASDDGRIVVGFPSLTNPADGQLVASASAGDSPGYREFAAGAALADSSCQSVTASYLAVEYADSDWPKLGAESDTLTLTIRPREVGTFNFDIRSTMHSVGGTPCAHVNAVPAGGEGGITDQQGWTVHRFAITVLPAPPRPAFAGAIVPSPAIVTLGGTFTITATVADSGAVTDDGRISLSFPDFTAFSDSQWVSPVVTGDDTPGYRESPRGSLLQRPDCSMTASSYLSVEYADQAWSGDGAETNQLVLRIRPQATGTFTIYVRSTMHWVPAGPCAYVDGIPTNAGQDTDQQGRKVGVVQVQVIPPAAPPAFTSPVAGIPTSIVLGESFTFTASVVNNGPTTDDGRISFGLPTLTGAGDGAWVSSASTGDAPGYLERAAGSVLADSACGTTGASYLVAEYADASWANGETNNFSVTVQPQVGGTFYVDVRSTLRDASPSAASCTYVNGLPIGGIPTTDQQGWTVRRFAVTVYGPEGPLPPPSIAWEPIPVPPGGPVARGGATAIYHPGQHAMIIYGGQSPVDYLGDVWSLSLGTGAGWSQISPGGPRPIRRILQSMVLSPGDNQVVIFGGYYDTFLNDVSVMAFTPVPWWFPNPGHGTPPSPRGGHAAVYDPVRDRMLVIGGFGEAMLNDVWECAPPATGTWRQLTPLGDPMPGRLQAASIYDPVRDRVLIFGGDGGPFLNDVWALNLSGDPTWEELHPVGGGPSPRREHTAIYDPVGDRMIIYGGFDADRQRRGDVWALNLAGSPSWSLLISSTPSPSARSGPVAVYDEALKRMVMYGGRVGTNQYSREVWGLNLDAVTPVAISLASAEMQSDHVRITWSAEGAVNLKATVERSEGASGEWTAVGGATAAGSDRLVFEDRTVVAGTRYAYRLVIAENGSPTISEPVWVTVPLPAILSLAGASPNPSENGVAVRFSLPGSEAATLELFDLKGRRIAAREVGSLGAGEHLVPLSERLNLAAGVYLVRLTQGRRTLTAKACVVK